MSNEVLVKTFKENLRDVYGYEAGDLAVDLFVQYCHQPGLLTSLAEQESFEIFLKKAFPEIIESLLLYPEFLRLFENAFPGMLKAFFVEGQYR